METEIRTKEKMKKKGKSELSVHFKAIKMQN